MSIYIVSHKELPQDIVTPDGYKPIFVGNRAEELKSKYRAIADTTGDSISALNSSFCELTAIYWVWKNVTDSIKGICHYRRYFLFDGEVVKEQKIGQLLSEYEFILPEKYWLMQSVENHYKSHHIGEDLTATKKIIEKKYPEYMPDFERALNQHYVYPYNMLIASNNSYDKYCEWLFPILFELASNADFCHRDQYQRRAIGFISERLTAVYMEHNRSSVYECRVLTTERNLKRTISMSVAKLLFGHQ